MIEINADKFFLTPREYIGLTSQQDYLNWPYYCAQLYAQTMGWA